MKLFGRKEKSTGEILAGGENAIANKEVEGLSQDRLFAVDSSVTVQR